MRKILSLAVCFLLLCGSVAHAELKVGVFDAQIVFTKSDALKQAQADMKKNYSGKKAALETKRKELEKLGASLGTTPSETQKADFFRLQNEYNNSANEYVRNVQESDLKIREEMDKLAVLAAQDVAKNKGLNMILDSTGAVYYDPSMDVTNDMLDAINRVWKTARKTK